LWLVPGLATAVAGALIVAGDSTQAEPPPVAQAAAPPAETKPHETPEKLARKLDLRVVAAQTGQPVPGARVSLYRAGWSRFPPADAGRCQVPLPTNLGAWEGFWISVVKDVYTPMRISWSQRDFVGDALKPYTLELNPAGPMGGVVRDEQGR